MAMNADCFGLLLHARASAAFWAFDVEWSVIGCPATGATLNSVLAGFGEPSGSLPDARHHHRDAGRAAEPVLVRLLEPP